MTPKDVDAIVTLLESNRKIDAIRVLRMHTSMDLMTAKTYLELSQVRERLTAEFVMDTSKLLRRAVNDLSRHTRHIEEMVLTLVMENEALSAECAELRQSQAHLSSMVDLLRLERAEMLQELDDEQRAHFADEFAHADERLVEASVDPKELAWQEYYAPELERIQPDGDVA